MRPSPLLIQRRTFLASCLAGGFSSRIAQSQGAPVEATPGSPKESAFSRIKKRLTEGKSATLLIISDTGEKQNAGVDVLLSKTALAQSLSKTLSIAVLCYIPAAAEQDMQVKFTTSASDQVTGSTQFARDNWKWIVLAGCVVPNEAKFASIGMYRSFAKAPNEVPFYIQKLVVVAGDAPAGAM